MNRPPRRGRSPPFGYDVRVAHGGRPYHAGSPLPPQPPPSHIQDYNEPYHHQQMQASNLYEFQHQQAGFMESSEPPHPHHQSHPHQYSIGYRDHHRLPSTYRATLREQPFSTQPQPNLTNLLTPSTTSAPYKILCVTNINHKVSDSPVRDALINEFSRFGDISVSICHDSGERLAYIYFRSYEEAREARHAKTRTLLFDKPIEIEPIYDPRASSPVESQAPNISNPQQFSRVRRSMTPPEYFNGPSLPPQARRVPLPPPPPPPPPPPHRGHPPNHNFNLSRYPAGPISSNAPPPTPYDRHYPSKASHLLPPKGPYASVNQEQYRSYPPPTGAHHHHHQPHHQYPYPHPYGSHSHGLQRERERLMNDSQVSRNARLDPHYIVDHRGLGYQQPPPPPPPSIKDSRRLPPPHYSSIHQHSSGRRSPSYPDHLPNRYLSREFIREKYGTDSYNNNNIEPEEGRPSRVLFITNVDQSKTDNEIKEIFDRFGLIEDIEVKKILGTDISSVLIRFSSMDCAYKAKTATNAKYLANSTKPCRIAYGKVSATKRLWIGGLGVSTTVLILQNEFKKYGNIVNIDYISGRPYAYVEYESANQAQFAMHHLKGTTVIEAERKLRIEYVESIADKMCENSKLTKNETNNVLQDTSTRSHSTNESWVTGDTVEQTPASPQYSNDANLKRNLSPNEDLNPKRFYTQSESKTDIDSKESPPPLPSMIIDDRPALPQLDNKEEFNRDQNLSTQSDESNNDRSNKFNSSETIAKNEEETSGQTLLKCTSISSLVDCCPISFIGQLVLRNFNFPSKVFMCSGNESVIEKYLVNLNASNGVNTCPVLKITQRWRLNPQPKLEEVRKKMQTANLGMLIFTSIPFNELSPSLGSSSPASCMKTPQTPTAATAVSTKQNGSAEKDLKDSDLDKTNTSNNLDSPTTTQSRPLKSLINYLEQKNAAGVISLSALDRDQTKSSKLLYAFPPGDFAMNLLRLKAPNLDSDSIKEEFLLGVIVGGTDNKI